MRKILLAVALAASLTACNSLPSPASLQNLPSISSNTSLAASYESLAQLRMLAVTELQSGKITVQTAQNVQAMADQVHALLDATRTTIPTADQLTQIANLLNAMSHQLGKTQ